MGAPGVKTLNIYVGVGAGGEQHSALPSHPKVAFAGEHCPISILTAPLHDGFGQEGFGQERLNLQKLPTGVEGCEYGVRFAVKSPPT